MKIAACWVYAIQKYGYPPNVKDTCRAIEEMAGMGFRNIELEAVHIEGISETNLFEIDREKEGIKKVCDDLGLNIVTFLPIIPNVVSLDTRKREEALSLFERSAELCRYFDCDLLSGDSHFAPLEFAAGTPYRQTIGSCGNLSVKVDPSFDWDEQWRVVVDSFARSSEIAAAAGLKLAIEPRVGEIVSNTDSFLRLYDAVKTENLGVILDTAHLHAQKETLVLSVEKLKDKIFYVHVSDNDSTQNRHLGLGKGNVDWPELFVALRKHGYDGYIGIDIAEGDSLAGEFLEAKCFLEKLIEP